MNVQIVPALRISLVFLGAIAFLTFSGTMEAKAQAGKGLFTSKGCIACHGPDGKKPLMTTYPKLAGQNADYLVLSMKGFKDQSRKGGQSALMYPMAATLSDADMKNIAAYLSKVK